MQTTSSLTDVWHVKWLNVWRTAALTVLTLGMLSACSKDTTELAPGNGDGVIRLSAAVTASGEIETDPKGQTRAPHKDETSTKAVLSDIHFLRKDGTSLPTDFSGVTALRANRDATGAITFTSGTNVPTYDKATDKNAYFMAYWPTSKTNATTVAVTSGVKVAWGIDGTTDVLVSTPYDAGKYSAPKVGTMTFQHVLAQLEVIVKAAPTTTTSLEAVQAMWGKINYILIENTPALVTYTFADNKVTYSDPMRRLLYHTDYKTAYINLPIPSSANTATTAAGMHSPVKGEPIRLLLQTQKFPDGIEVPVQLKDTQGANCDFEAGKRYVVTLTLGADDKQVDVSSTVAEWNTGRTGQGSSTWAAPAVGDFYYTDGTWSTTKDATKTVDGLVYWIDPEDPAHFKLVAPADAKPAGSSPDAQGRVTMEWNVNMSEISPFYPGILANDDSRLNEPEAELVSASGRLSGIANRAWVGQWLANPVANVYNETIADFPCFKACDDQGPGWYLPALNELQQLYCAYYGIPPTLWASSTPPAAAADYPAWWDGKLEEGFAVERSPSYPYYYWASSLSYYDYSAEAAWCLNFAKDTPKLNELETTSTALVRCIKEINPVGQAAAPKVEDYYYSDGTWSRALIPGKTPEGVIYWVDAANPEHFKVVDMDGPPAAWDGGGNPAGKLPWSNESKYIGVDNANGKANTLKIMQTSNADKYKAAKWCYTRNEGLLGTAASAVTLNTPGYDWYLPAKDELCQLFHSSRGVVMTATWEGGPPSGLAAISGYPEAWNARFTKPIIMTDDNYYYSSTTLSNNPYSYVLRFRDGNLAGSTKTTHNYVRCVREVGAPAAPVVRPKVEDYFYSDGTFSRDFDPHKSLEGVVFWIDEYDSKRFMVVSMIEPPALWNGGTNAEGILLWSTENMSTLATNHPGGDLNTLHIMKLATANDYPAAKWCYTRNAGASVPASSSVSTGDANYKWFLPAKNELQALFCAYHGVDPTTWTGLNAPAPAAGYPKAWTDRFATGTPFVSGTFWSSTQENASASWIVNFTNGNTSTIAKDSATPRVRCIREVTLP